MEVGLPSSHYVDATHFELERQAMWATSWVSVCREQDVADAGAFVTASVATDPVMVVRGNDGELRGFGNVCPHRSSTIMEGAGTARALQCPYHLWTFRLDGSLATAPDMGDLIRDDVCLPAIAVGVWHGWVFVNLDIDAAPLGPQIAGLSDRIDAYDFGSLRRAGVIVHDQAWNWKITVENFGESYHHAAVHPKTLHATYPGQRSWVEDGAGEPWFWLDHVSTDDSEPFAVCVAFPAHLFSIIRGLGMVWFRIEALAPRATRLTIELFLPEDLVDDQELVDGVLDALRTINDEDSMINERVDAGLNSRWSAPGPASHLEAGCQQFREWISAHTT